MASTSDPPEKSAKEHPHTTHFHGKEPRDPLAILLNAAKSGTRSAIIAFSARAFLTLLLRLARGRMSAKQARAIFLGDEPRRFAAMFGTFTFLFKALNGLLGRLVMGRPARRVSILTHEEDVPAEKLSLRSPRFLIAAVSGFLAALPALSFEKGEERLGWAQQFFVRGLQCWVVFLARERGVYVPHGDSLVFILSCAQIMYAYILRPSTIPSAYYNWMVKTARVPGPILEINRRNVRALDDLDRVKFGLPPESATARERLRNVVEGVQDPVLNPTNLLEIATKFGANPARVEKLSKSIETSGLPLPIVPCELLHACGNHGCVRHNVWLFNQVFWEISRVYGVLNVVPVLIFGRRRLMKEPLGVAKRLLASTARSSAFLAVYVTSYMVMACLTRNLQGIHLLTRDHKTLYYLFGIVSGCAIFVERDGRRGELAAYVLPKAAESAWRVWADRGYLPKWVRGGDFGMFAVGLGLLMGFYQTAPSYISPLLYALMRRVVA